MPSSRRIPIAVYAAVAALAAAGVPFLAVAAWRTFVWRSPGDPDAVRSLLALATIAAALGLLVAGQLVLLVLRRREVGDAVAAADVPRLETAVRRTVASVRLAAGTGAAVLLGYLAVVLLAASRAAPAGADWAGFGLPLALLTGPALVAIAAPAGLVRLDGADPAGLARAIRRVGAGRLVAGAALGAVLCGAAAGFALAEATCRPGGNAAVCGGAYVSMGQVAGSIGPAVALVALALADRGLRALWALRYERAGAGSQPA